MLGGMAPGGASAADTTLVKALARAFRWRQMMETGRFVTIDEFAAAEKINSSYVSRLLRLTLLAPDIVQAILDGQQPEGMTLPALMEPFPVGWGLQAGVKFALLKQTGTQAERWPAASHPRAARPC